MNELDALSGNRITRYVSTMRCAIAGFLNDKSQEYKQSADFFMEYPDTTLAYAIGKLCAALSDFCSGLAEAIMCGVGDDKA